MNKISSFAVLLAAYNGEKWLKEQILSILNQKNVEVHIFISLDVSTDNSLSIILDLKSKYDNIHLLSYGDKFGGAAKNFYRIIKETDLKRFDFIALADQDDIWLDNKLNRGSTVMTAHDFAGYSSNVIAFWPNKKTKLIRKSYPLKNYDFMFESAGPGCSYILKKSTMLEFQSLLINKWEIVNKIEYHDWLLFAFVRPNSKKWFIDQAPTLMYRQHENNQLGANTSLKSFKTRYKLIRSGWYFNQVQLICGLLDLPIPNRWFIMKNYYHIRRNTLETLFLLFTRF